MDYDRRHLLSALGAAGSLAAAGCLSAPDGDPQKPEGPGATTTTADGTATDGTTTDGTFTPREDLPDYDGPKLTPDEDGVLVDHEDFRLTQGPTVGLEPIATGLTSPTQFVAAPGSPIAHVVDQTGVIWTLEEDGFRDDPFLDFRDRVVVSPERGLLGLAFHPDYPEDRRVFVRYSSPPRDGTPDAYTHTAVLAEFETTADGTAIDVDTERALMEIPHPLIYHQAGTVVFGPEGYLYVPMGESTKHWKAQDVETNLLGGIHRIDVDGESGDKPYAIPEDNPLVGEPGRDEYYAWGFRNPWRVSFNDGTLIAGDVGSYGWEEVDVVEKGNNYGWPYKEGSHCHEASPSASPDRDCQVTASEYPGEELVDPVAEFPHSIDGTPVGTAVIGGYVYDREDVPGLEGKYVFSNYTADLEVPSGYLFAADPSGGDTWPLSKLSISNGPGNETNRVINSMGRDAEGRLYVLTTRIPDKGDRFSHRAGEVLRVVPPGTASTVLEPGADRVGN